MEYKIIALKDFRWRKDQTRMHKGGIVDIEENELMVVPDEISEKDSLEMESLGLIAFVDENGEPIDDDEVEESEEEIEDEEVEEESEDEVDDEEEL